MKIGGNVAVTLKQIAERTGVSIPTVHQILNKYDVRFSAATREKVLAAAAELRYTPNLAARSLVQQRSLLIGVLYYGVNFFAVNEFSRGIQSAMKPRGYAPIFLTHANVAEELDNARLVMERHVDGIILNVAVEPDGSTQIGQLTDLINKTPTVEIFGRFMHGAPNVRLDYEAASKAAVESLIKLGHRVIALAVREKFDQPGERYWSARDFYQGYRSGLQAADLKSIVHPYAVAEDTTRPNAGFPGAYALAPKLMKDAHRPTSVVCYARESAEAILRWCEQHPEQVPSGFTIAFFGDPLPVPSDVVQLLVLPFPAAEVGGKAIESLFKLMDGKRAQSFRLSPSYGWLQSDGTDNHATEVAVRAEPLTKLPVERRPRALPHADKRKDLPQHSD